MQFYFNGFYRPVLITYRLLVWAFIDSVVYHQRTIAGTRWNEIKFRDCFIKQQSFEILQSTVINSNPDSAIVRIKTVKSVNTDRFFRLWDFSLFNNQILRLLSIWEPNLTDLMVYNGNNHVSFHHCCWINLLQFC